MSSPSDSLIDLPSLPSSDDINNIVVSPPDPVAVASALSAWLAELGVADEGDEYDVATDHCVSLCSVFASIAPHLMEDKDYFIPNKATTTVTTRQRKYNTRRLARGLAEWFGLSSRSNSPINGQAANDESDSPSDPPCPLAHAAKQRVKTITDAARAESESVDDPVLRLALGELVLCAAINSPEKKRFVTAVLKLNPTHQDALAQSVKYSLSESEHSPFTDDLKQPTVLGEVRASSENAPPSQRFAPSHNASGSARTQKSYAVLGFAPQDIPPAEFKALAEERDTLRKKLSICEAEKNEALGNNEQLLNQLQTAADRLQEFKSKIADTERAVEEKSSELSQAKAALRDVCHNSEEVERLRSKANTAEQLEISLKRASKRLEHVADMRNKMKDLESENGALRSNQDHMAKQIEILESTLTSANERAENLVKVSDDLSHELEAKTGEVRDIMSKNQELNQKLGNVNDQLSQLLMNPPPTEESKLDREARERELDNDIISKRLSEEVGVHMPWSEIIDCIRGVMEAMSEMDEQKYGGNCETSFSSSTSPSHQSIDYAPPEQHPESRSVPEGNTVADQTAVQLLPDFALVDSKHEAQRGDIGDQFDYAVDHPNIQEIPVMNRRPSLSTVPEDREGFEDEQDDDVPEPVAYHHSKKNSMQDAPVGPGYPILSNHHSEVPSIHPPMSSDSEVAENAHSMGVDANGMIVRQTRSDIPGISNALDAMRLERDTNTSLAALLQQLADARDSTERFKIALVEKERECEIARHDLHLLLKEHNSVTVDRNNQNTRHEEVLREKERMITHLERNLASREEELKELRKQAEGHREATEALRAMELQMASATHEHTVMVRAQEIEIARLTTKLEASELIAGKLSVAMDRTDGLTEEIHKARETYLADMAEAARREKLAAEEARAEAERMAQTHQRAVADMQQAQAAAAARTPSVCCSDSARKPRRSHRLTNFWRRIMHLDGAENARENVTGTVVMQAPHPALQAATTGPISAPSVLNGAPAPVVTPNATEWEPST